MKEAEMDEKQTSRHKAIDAALLGPRVRGRRSAPPRLSQVRRRAVRPTHPGLGRRS
jgi:hypothetical protein